MGLIDHSTMWLVAVGKTTVHSLWIGAMILALLKLILSFIPVRYSGTRYNISVVALLALFSSVIATFLTLYEPVVHVPESFFLPRVHTTVPWNMMQGIPGEAGTGDGLVFTLFAYIYFTGILFMVFRSFLSTRYLLGMRRSSTPIEPRYRERFLHLCSSLGIKRKVDLLQSARVDSPMLLGYIKPIILVPAGMFTHLPLNQVETILIHELYHLKRWDHLINLLQLFIEGVLFYHPVVWVISGQIRCEREHCCDDRVLKVTDNPLMYAKALIHMAGQQQVPRLAPGAAGPGKHRFASRIKRIINTNTMKTNMRDKVLSLALLMGSIILLLTISGFSSGPSFFRIQKLNDEQIKSPETSLVLPAPDTIPEKRKSTVEEADEEPDWEALEKEMEEARQDAERALEELDWEKMKEEMEAAREEAERAMEEIDWEKMKEEMEAAQEDAKRAMEEIDWEKMKEEMEAAKEDAKRAMEEIDWEELKEEMEAAREDAKQAMEEIDWEKMKEEIEAAREDAKRAMEEIDWEKMKEEMELNISEMKMDIENSLNEMDWDEIREELEKSSVFLDSIKIEMDR